MARSDLVVNLVKAGIQGNHSDFRSTAEAIASDERAKRHTGVADRIARVLETSNSPTGSRRQVNSAPRTRDASGGIKRTEPSRSFYELHLPKAVKNACEELVEEQQRADILRSHGYEPRHRLLLVGPPGNGKTSLAEGLAYELALPLFTVRYESVVTSYLGETAQRLSRLFEFIKTEPCVLFFDEFDAIGKERGDIHETGEIKRVVTTLLLQLDELPSYCVLVGATNHPELLDRAAWRRFQLRLELNDPDEEQMIKYFSDQLDCFEEKPGYTSKRLYSLVKPRNFSEAEAFFQDVKRRHILSLGGRELRSTMSERIKVWNLLNKDSELV